MNSMEEQATVLQTNNEFATVRIARNSACGSCGRCGMTEKQKYIDVYAVNELGAKVGDIVKVSLAETSASGLALVGYILPLVPALVLMFVSLALGWKEWFSLVLFFVGYAFGFGIVAIIDKLKHHKWTKQAQIVDIVSHSNNLTEKTDDVNENVVKGGIGQ